MLQNMRLTWMILSTREKRKEGIGKKEKIKYSKPRAWAIERIYIAKEKVKNNKTYKSKNN